MSINICTFIHGGGVAWGRCVLSIHVHRHFCACASEAERKERKTVLLFSWNRLDTLQYFLSSSALVLWSHPVSWSALAGTRRHSRRLAWASAAWDSIAVVLLAATAGRKPRLNNRGCKKNLFSFQEPLSIQLLKLVRLCFWSTVLHKNSLRDELIVWLEITN